MAKKFLHDADFDGNSVVGTGTNTALRVTRTPGATGNFAEIGTLGAPLVTVTPSEIQMTGPLTIADAAHPTGLTVNGMAVESTRLNVGSGTSMSIRLGSVYSQPVTSQSCILIGGNVGVQQGHYTVAIGSGALAANTSQSSVAIGYYALNQATAASSHVAIGFRAGHPVTAGTHGLSVKGGSNSVFVGPGASGNTTDSPDYAVAVGNFAMADSNSVAIGRNSAAVTESIAIGVGANGGATHTSAANTVQLLANATTGAHAYLGADELLTRPVANTDYVNVTGDTMTGALTIAIAGATPSTLLAKFGDAELRSSGGSNTAVGYASQRALTTGSGNTALGYGSQNLIANGSGNSAVGYQAQQALTAGIRNSAFGYGAQQKLTTGNSNNGIGYQAQQRLTTGTGNNGIGYVVQGALTTGAANCVLGHGGQGSLTVGQNNNAVGHDVQRALVAGNNNNAVGFQAQGVMGPEMVTPGSNTITFTPDPNFSYLVAGSGVVGTAGGVPIAFNSNGTWQPTSAASVTITATSGLTVHQFLTPSSTSHTNVMGYGAYTTGDHAIAIGSNAAAAANTVQLGDNTQAFTGFLGNKKIATREDIQNMVANSTDFVDFQNKIAKWTVV